MSKLFLCLHGAVAKGVFDVIHENTTALQSEFPGQYFSVAIEEEGGGQDVDTAVAQSDRFFAEQDGIIYAHVFCELCNVVGAGVVHGNADNLKSLRAIFLLEFDEPGHFYFAGSTVGSPKIQQNSFAAQA